MKISSLNALNVPPGTYYFPKGTLDNSGIKNTAGNNGLISVQFRPKDATDSNRDTDDISEEDEFHPQFRFSNKEKRKKRQLMNRLKSRR